VWLYSIWHIATPAFVLVYSFLKDANPPESVRLGSTASTIGWCAATVVCLVCGLTLLTTAGERFLPVVFVDSTHANASRLTTIATATVLIAAAALAMLWVRRRSVLDYWLMLVIGALISEQILTAALNSARFSLGFYAARAFSLVTSIFVLGLLLSEITRLYARLARANMLLERERENKLMNVQATIAAIAHEIRQPLSAMTTNASAAQRWLERTPPDQDKARASLEMIKNESLRVSGVFDSILALFGRVNQEQQPVDVNDIILSVTHSLEEPLNDYGVAVHLDLAAELPLIAGHSGQLREVIINLGNNALEAMRSTTSRSRVLHVRTELRDRDTIAVAIQDTGPGIDADKLAKIFDAFVTTKPLGTGLGLAICRAIVERHGGQLTASSDGKSGALFQLVLPIASIDKTARAK
jgi:signal transduction histidine kinase